jgi:ferredoxin-NADP reductase
MTHVGPEVRPMSLATSPTRPHLEYAVRLSNSWYKRAFAALLPGDMVAVFGPIGDFVLRENRPAILVAGGIGVTPLKGMAEYATDSELPIPIRLVYSSRSEDEIAYRAELAKLESENPHFSVWHTLTGAPAADWRGVTGRIDRNLVRDPARDLVDPVYYVSGTPSMVLDAWHLLREEGIPADSIEVEAFRGYR